MYRDYESPKALEQQLKVLESAIALLENKDSSFENELAEQGDCKFIMQLKLNPEEKEALLEEFQLAANELEQRINFAWQDEEFDYENEY